MVIHFSFDDFVAAHPYIDIDAFNFDIKFKSVSMDGIRTTAGA